jgi:hypothetical protein
MPFPVARFARAAFRLPWTDQPSPVDLIPAAFVPHALTLDPVQICDKIVKPSDLPRFTILSQICAM